jgi:hypothetical protein
MIDPPGQGSREPTRRPTIYRTNIAYDASLRNPHCAIVCVGKRSRLFSQPDEPAKQQIEFTVAPQVAAPTGSNTKAATV